MKLSILFARSAGILTLALCAAACALFSPSLRADPAEAPQKPLLTQRFFTNSDDAINALRAAVQSADPSAIEQVFGPEYSDLATGDASQDALNARRFADALAQKCEPVKEGDDKISLVVGTNEWPMPVPLVRTNGLWHFDLTAGKEEILNRRIGKDELIAVGVCRVFVAAQRHRAAQAALAGDESAYSLKFRSSHGKMDGLYWPASANEPPSPFGFSVAQAQVEGSATREAAGRHPFHGYYFKILTRQGPDAPGFEMNYLSGIRLTGGKLTGGFALVAFPAQWGDSGVMTFIVNQDGFVYERNLGENTARTAASMTAYNPDSNWTLVSEQGLTAVVTEN